MTTPAACVDPETLSSVASHYAQGMTSIRGRRVQRLLNREFAGAEYVLVVQAASGRQAVLGITASGGAALCATDGRGAHASVLKWRHGSTTALQTRFNLLKDSLPVQDEQTLPLAELGMQLEGWTPAGPVALPARALVAEILQVPVGASAGDQ